MNRTVLLAMGVLLLSSCTLQRADEYAIRAHELTEHCQVARVSPLLCPLTEGDRPGRTGPKFQLNT